MSPTKPMSVNAKGKQYRLIAQCPLKDLKHYKRNPRQNDLAAQEVAKSIELFGFISPIIANEKMEICAGHTRHKAATLLGLKTVPVIVVPGLTGNRFKGYNLADNKTGEIAGWDSPELGKILAELKADSFDLGSLGFSDAELNEIMAQLDTNPVSNGLGAVPDGNAYSEQFGVIVICENEDHQAETYNRLTKQGMNCKVVTT